MLDLLEEGVACCAYVCSSLQMEIKGCLPLRHNCIIRICRILGCCLFTETSVNVSLGFSSALSTFLPIH